MRKRLLSICGLGFAYVAQAQNQAANYGQQLAAVHSVASAECFMRSLGGEFADIKLDSLLLDEQENCAHYQLHPADTIAANQLDACARYDIPRPAAWAKADFDQDGQPDLLINAGYGRAYAVLSRRAQPPLVVPVAGGRHRSFSCNAFELRQVAGRPAIAHLQIQGGKFGRRSHYEATARQDTLVYHLGAFVEYNARPATKLPRLLRYHYNDGGPGPRTIYDLRINLKAGRVRCRVSATRSSTNWPLIGRWHYQLRAGTADTLQRQVAYVPIARLSPEYAINAYDASTYRLTFYPRHQPPRLVGDYGGDGPYALQRLYRLLDAAHDQEMERRRQRLQTTRQQEAGRR